MRLRLRYARAHFWFATSVATLGPGQGCQPTPAVVRATRDATPVSARPESLQLGDLKPGERGHAPLTLRNQGASPVRVARVESSCPCVRVSPLPADLSPAGSVELRVDFDPAEEPDFRGRLGVELTGYGPDGTSLFKSRVNVGVVSDER